MPPEKIEKLRHMSTMGVHRKVVWVIYYHILEKNRGLT